MKLRACISCLDNIAEPDRPRCRDCTPGANGHSRMPAAKKPPPRALISRDISRDASCAGDISSAREPDLVVLDPARIHAALNP
jgi:hypothetical protein